jgi:hypothetical protein
MDNKTRMTKSQMVKYLSAWTGLSELFSHELVISYLKFRDILWLKSEAEVKAFEDYSDLLSR